MFSERIFRSQDERSLGGKDSPQLSRIIKAHLRGERDKDLTTQSRKRELAGAVITLLTTAVDQLDFGSGDNELTSGISELGLKPKPDEDQDLLSNRAAQICINSGLSAMDVAGVLPVLRDDLEATRQLSVRGAERVGLSEAVLAREIASLYRSAMGHED